MGEVDAHFAEIYGVSVWKELISRIIEAVIAEMREWASRPLVFAAVVVEAMMVEVGSRCPLARSATDRSTPPSATPWTAGRRMSWSCGWTPAEWAPNVAVGLAAAGQIGGCAGGGRCFAYLASGGCFLGGVEGQPEDPELEFVAVGEWAGV